MPVAPGAHLLGLARLLNRMMRKLGDQADRQKIVTLVSRAASQNGTGQAAVEAEDGEAIPTDDPKVRRPNIDKARRILKWEPVMSLDEGLKATIAYFKNLLDKGLI